MLKEIQESRDLRDQRETRVQRETKEQRAMQASQDKLVKLELQERMV